MIFEVHAAGAVVDGRGGMAVMLSCVQDDRSAIRYMTHIGVADLLSCQIKATEIALSSIKSKWKSSQVVLYVPTEVHKLISGRAAGNVEQADFLKRLCSTFGSISVRTPPLESVIADAVECAKSGKVKDTETMVTE